MKRKQAQDDSKAVKRTKNCNQSSFRDQVAVVVDPFLLPVLVPLVMDYVGSGIIGTPTGWQWKLEDQRCSGCKEGDDCLEPGQCHHLIIESIAWTGDGLLIVPSDLNFGDTTNAFLFVKNDKVRSISVDFGGGRVLAFKGIIYFETPDGEVGAVSDQEGEEEVHFSKDMIPVDYSDLLAVDSKEVIVFEKEAGKFCFFDKKTTNATKRLKAPHGLSVGAFGMTDDKLLALDNKTSEVVIMDRVCGELLSRWSVEVETESSVKEAGDFIMVVIDKEVFIVDNAHDRKMIQVMSMDGEFLYTWKVDFYITAMCTDGERLFVAGNSVVKAFK